jgi:hypothetical protein
MIDSSSNNNGSRVISSNREYDAIIAGGGVAGVFAAQRICQSNKNIKVALIEFGRPPGKRRRQLEGWLGCFPTGNARLYMNNINKVESVTGSRLCKKATASVFELLADYGPTKPSKCKRPTEDVRQRITKLGYVAEYLDFVQWRPDMIHLFAKEIAERIEEREKIDFFFDNEIRTITKEKSGRFVVETEGGTFYAKKVLLCLGRSGWRLANATLNHFKLVEHNDFANFGFRAEMPTSYMKDWNTSHCTLSRGNVTLGPLSWCGTVIPEDHVDLVISSWRSNEDRWYSDKVSFSVMLKEKFNGAGTQQTERLGKLAYVLADNRVGRTKVSEYMNNRFDLSLVPEYMWLKHQMKELDFIFPSFINKAYINVPDIGITIPDVRIKSNLETNVPGLFVAGESAGMIGILSAAISGYIAGEGLCKNG